MTVDPAVRTFDVMTRSRATTTNKTPLTIAALVSGALLAATACGGGGGDDSTDEATAATTTDVPATTTAVGDPPDTTAPPPATTESSATIEDPPADDLAAIEDEIRSILEAALADTDWDCCGPPVVQPTLAVAGVRVPGHDDLLVAVGSTVDGGEVDPAAPFNVASLTVGLVKTIAYQLIDEGVLDPDATVDGWAPGHPNADRVTVQMLADSTTGWGPVRDGIIEELIVPDLSRSWTLAEVVEAQLPIAAQDEPGTLNSDQADSAVAAVLALILEAETGSSLDELVQTRVVAPLGLTATLIPNGDDLPADYLHGVLAFEGSVVATSMFPGTAYATWFRADNAVVSTAPDLLSLLDAWASGALFTTDRQPTSERFDDDRAYPWGTTYVGLGLPFNMYCPCESDGDGNTGVAIGRQPAHVFTRNFVLRYADGISVVLHVNSQRVADPADVRAVADEIHAAANAAL